MSRDSLVACPDPEERLFMRIERIGERELRTDDLACPSGRRRRRGRASA